MVQVDFLKLLSVCLILKFHLQFETGSRRRRGATKKSQTEESYACCESTLSGEIVGLLLEFVA